MKKYFVFLFLITSSLALNAQCSELSVSVSSSDTSYVQLYHAGFFLILSGEDNICEWEVSTFSGEIIFQDTTSGAAFEQGLVLFDHSVPLTDSMKVTIFITNETEAITCTISDTLFWNQVEVLPGIFVGNWEVLSDNGGIEEEITSSEEIAFAQNRIKIFPSPALDYFQIVGNKEYYRITIFDLKGQALKSIKNIGSTEKVDISNLSKGTYIIQFQDEFGAIISSKKLFKL